jgi:aerobic carbon-monoxide dehydrogenase medium subunit
VALTSVEAYYRPADDKGVIEQLQKHEDNALLIAGGTFLHGLIARGLLSGIEAFIDLGQLGLNTVHGDSKGLEIGATTVFAQLQAMDEVQTQPWLGAIRDAIACPPVQIRNTATVGGSIAASCPFFDLPVCTLALDGVVQARGAGGKRDISLEEFFPGLFENALQTDEFMVGLTLPAAADNSSSAFEKLETNANDLAILNAAVLITGDGKGSCKSARVFIGGGVGETPYRATAAEEVLSGAKLGADVFTAAGEAASSEIDPIDDHRASAEYRRYMARILVQRALQRASDRLNGGV